MTKKKRDAPAGNRTRGPSMGNWDFTTKPLARLLLGKLVIFR